MSPAKRRSSAASRRARRVERRAASVAATTASLDACRAARALAHAALVLEMLVGEHVARQLHDRIGEALALVGLDPRLDAAAAEQQRRREPRDEREASRTPGPAR